MFYKASEERLLVSDGLGIALIFCVSFTFASYLQEESKQLIFPSVRTWETFPRNT